MLASAAHEGARILEKYGCRGTFYIAGSLTSRQEEGRPAHTLSDILDLQARSHEIGSHGWGHINYAKAVNAEIHTDQSKNLAFLQSHLNQSAGSSFAYPFGQYDLRSKLLTARAHSSCRILGNGLHRQRADLNLLGCHRLYGPGRQQNQWQLLLNTMQPGDWLIVNTHEVEFDCGTYGCTPTDLATFIEAAQSLGSLILPVASAISHYRSQP
ncbi:polysaccharide deacetylase family protein [Pusillimonas sp. CC-YST705]|uniref:Polysaccharide deacetylase family protein n=1 Tax=Mesopusillimonas faecipullorum TaxID=2755040 RepID=A0ABS8CEU3_9BURK|nr:polysaccharide deacetylase family protein [Mesopusillimonas faecipullorum]